MAHSHGKHAGQVEDLDAVEGAIVRLYCLCGRMSVRVAGGCQASTEGVVKPQFRATQDL